MIKVYADNAATSFPKPKEVSRAMCDYIDNIGSNVGRGSYQSSYEAGRIVYETRELLCDIFNNDDPLNVIFTLNITESLNTLIKGLLKQGDHVIVSSMEHNAVMRPLNSDSLKGIQITKINCNNEGYLNAVDVENNIKQNTKLVVMIHASNVCGTILPIEAIGNICRKYNIDFIVDSAQTAGVLNIDIKKYNISALAFTGHKGLLGPQGTGGFIINNNLSKKIKPLKEGGTGSYSEFETHPNIMPDKFECGTLNIPGIYGLNASLKYLQTIGISNIRAHEEMLTIRFLNKILNIDNVTLTGTRNIDYRTAVFSLNFNKIDNSEAAFILDSEYGIMTRVGLHCSPSAHKTLGTFHSGSVRFSFGYFSTEQEVDYIASSITQICKL